MESWIDRVLEREEAQSRERKIQRVRSSSSSIGGGGGAAAAVVVPVVVVVE